MAQDPSKIQPEKISIYKEKEIEDYRTEQKEMNSEGQKKSQEQEDIATCDHKARTLAPSQVHDISNFIFVYKL